MYINNGVPEELDDECMYVCICYVCMHVCMYVFGVPQELDDEGMYACMYMVYTPDAYFGRWAMKVCMHVCMYVYE
jgi:hypothetical protein